MTLHVCALPHTQITKEYSACAYTQKVRKFVPMMEAQGFTVQLHQYVSKKEQKQFGFNGPQDYAKLAFDCDLPIWELANTRAITAIENSHGPEDIVCIIGGSAQQPIADAAKNMGLPCVEFGVGYPGVCEGTYKVFESVAWRHFVYGWRHAHGAAFDDVIPNYYEIDTFPIVDEPEDHFAFVGRLDANKGLGIAQAICEEMGRRLIIVGAGPQSGYGNFTGLLPANKTIGIIANAQALFCPTQYVGPFEGVHIEALLCGTPVITTDWGVFTETVTQGVNGFRCKMYRDYHLAVRNLDTLLSRYAIAKEARIHYSLATVGKRYAEYFERIATLRDRGWYTP